MPAASIKLEALDLAAPGIAPGAAGPGGGLPVAVVGPWVDLGRPSSLGFVLVEAELGESPSPQWSTTLSLSIRTRGEAGGEQWREAAALVLQGAGTRSAIDVVRLDRFVMVHARLARAGADARHVRFRIERAR